MKVSKKKGALGAMLIAGIAMIVEHWFTYGKIDPVFGHEWAGWILVTVSMILLALEQRSEGAEKKKEVIP